MKTLTPHPRLYIGRKEIDRLAADPDTELLRHAAAGVDGMAAEFVKSPVFEWKRNTHNAHLIRARQMQTRIVTLLVQWLRTGRAKYRTAVIEHVREMGNWQCWSWIAWREGDCDPNAIFDLSYGENSATLAIAYDLLHDTLSSPEKKLFLGIAARRALIPCMKHMTGKRKSWWLKAGDCNWLTVCGGGAGMLCLAMYEDLPVARRLLPMLDRALMAYARTMDELKGGWKEGVGYWNYGMRYGYMYWLSHERATGREHRAMKLPGAKKTLRFPMDFSPCNVGTGFGDIPVPFVASPFHYAAAARFRDTALMEVLDSTLRGTQFARVSAWPCAAEYLLFRPREKATQVAKKVDEKVAKLYPVVEWGILADRMPDPKIYLSIRGGSTAAPHAHLDVLSYNCVINGEKLIPSVGSCGYIDTTFSNRRFEMFDIGFHGKNTILIGGVGVQHPATVKTKKVAMKGAVGFRMDARDAIRIGYRQPLVKYVGRLFLMLEGEAFLIVDRVEVEGTNCVESRFFTYAGVKFGSDSVGLTGAKARCRAAFGSDVETVLAESHGVPTRPQGDPPAMVRVVTKDIVPAATIATLITPSLKKTDVTVKTGNAGIAVTIRTAKLAKTIRLSHHLTPKRERAPSSDNVTS